MKRSVHPTTDTLDFVEGETPRTVAELIYRRLRWDIVWGALPPGARLRSDELRLTYGVGISPLREALARLLVERLVTSIGQRGFRVAAIQADDVLDVTETRLLVERAALARSIERGDLKWEARIVASFHALSKIEVPLANDETIRRNWAGHHREFHMALLSACGSAWQMKLANLLFDQADRFRLMPGVSAIFVKAARDPTDEHKRIMQATLARNVNKALSLLEMHYRATAAIVLETMQLDTPSTSRRKSATLREKKGIRSKKRKFAKI